MRRRSSSTAPAAGSRASQSSARAKPSPWLVPMPRIWLKPSFLPRRPVDDGARHGAGLAEQRQPPGLGHQVRQAGIQPERRQAEAEAVGAERAHPRALAHSGEAGRGHRQDGGEAAARRQRRHGRLLRGGRQAEHGEVRRLGQRGDIRHRLQPRRGQADGEEAALEAPRGQVARQHRRFRQRRVGQQRHRARPEQRGLTEAGGAARQGEGELHGAPALPRGAPRCNKSLSGRVTEPLARAARLASRAQPG
ncbi:hypothetical protein ACFFMP_03735 [Pseudoroseomonas cervicalis]